jgi:predicted protein tyrosine phosphatase
LQAPKDTDFDQLVDLLWHAPDPAAFIFNCQMGRGRTTTGMVIASLVALRRMGALDALCQADRGAAAVLPLTTPEWLLDNFNRSLHSQVSVWKPAFT